MNALRIVFLVLAFGVLGVVGWRTRADHLPAAVAPPRPIAVLREPVAPPEPKPAAPAAPLAASSPVDAAVSRPAVAAATEPPAVAAAGSSPVVAVPPPVVASAPPPSVVASLGVVAPAPPRAEPRQDRLTDVPEFAAFFDRLKLDFPHDYIAIVGHLDQAGPEAPAANAAIWDALRDLEQSRGILAAQAAAPMLDRFFDARSALLDGLAPLNARQCADFLYGITDASMAEFTAAHRGLVATLADRTLEAIADGRDRHDDRVLPTPADLDALSAGLAAHGLQPVEIGLLMDGTVPDPPLPDARVCAIGRVYLDVLHGLPPDARQRVYGLAAELLARS